VPRLADWVAVHLVESEDNLERIASVHRNPDKVARMIEVDRNWTNRKTNSNPVWHSLQTGEPKLLRYMEPDVLSSIAQSDDHLKALQEIGFASLMCIPLLSRGRALGIIVMGRASPTRPFDIEDLKFAVELGQRASLAVDNVRLFRETQLANRSKDEFLATVSHELRTPMNVILGWLEILQNENPDKATVDQALQTLDRNARVQVELINDLLDVSRIISGKMTIAPRQVSVGEVVDLAVDSVLPAARAKGLKVARHIDPHLPVVNADPDRLQQIFWNLLTNAVKFTPSNGSIEVSVRNDANDVLIQVRDSGMGIEPRFLPYVFERFRQEDGSTTRRHGGLGIGLALVRYLAEAHGGSVNVQSQGKGMGSTFTVRLPASNANQSAAFHQQRSKEAQAQFAAASAPTENTKGSLEGIHVCLVDDSPDVRMLLTRILSKAGAKVDAYETAPDALKALETMNPDVLVSDIGLPEMDGYSFIRELRSREQASHRQPIPAAALTAFAQSRDADHAIRSGFDKHIAKPVRSDDLLKAVQQLAHLKVSRLQASRQADLNL
jgi:signal transduction histidine kinase/ActR/RegA family two-component response regulator